MKNDDVHVVFCCPPPSSPAPFPRCIVESNELKLTHNAARASRVMCPCFFVRAGVCLAESRPSRLHASSPCSSNTVLFAWLCRFYFKSRYLFIPPTASACVQLHLRHSPLWTSAATDRTESPVVLASVLLCALNKKIKPSRASVQTTTHTHTHTNA